MEADWEEAKDSPPERALVPPLGASGRPMPHPAGTGRATEGEVEDWGGGGYPFCFFIRVGGGVLPTCHPYPRQSHMEEEQSVPTYLFMHLPASLMFSFSVPQRCGSGTWGEGPQGICDSPPPWSDLILGSPGFSTASASLKPECQGLLPSNRRWGGGPVFILGG